MLSSKLKAMKQILVIEIPYLDKRWNKRVSKNHFDIIVSVSTEPCTIFHKKTTFEFETMNVTSFSNLSFVKRI